MIAAKYIGGDALIHLTTFSDPIVAGPVLPPDSDWGLDILLVVPDFASPPRLAASRAHILTDIGAARRNAAFAGRRPAHAFTWEFLLEGREEIAALEEFFYAHAGRWSPFYVPSWHRELVLAEDAEAGAEELVVEGVGYAAAYLADTDPDAVGHRLFLYGEDGALHVAEVESAVDGGATDTLTLSAGLGAAFEAGRTVAGFVYRVRFAGDELVLDYHSPERASAQVGLVEVIPVDSTVDV